MASIVPGFEYDIFISYRQNDNLPVQGSGRQAGSGWVSDFIESLKKELAATLKEPLSIYFDQNPHDGLLETDVVDDSLKDKLKCLIFIPILSQTYCDPKSFAWQNEFLVFKKLTSEDPVGLKIKLANGNTTTRILPIKIHDLDAEDQTLIENEIGPLRAIDLIFRSPGVNRPLTLADSRADNLNKTFYRDQVNKVANCIKEIIGSLKSVPKLTSAGRSGYAMPALRRPVRKKMAWAGGIVLSLLIATFFVYNFFQSGPEPRDKSIAVLPFDDMSEKHDQEYFSDGISEEIIDALVKIEGLKVPSRTSSFQFKGKNMDLKEIGAKLKVAFVLEGSVRKSGDRLRITAQLINANNGFHLWSATYNHDLKDIFKAQDEVSQDILKQLRKRLGALGTLAERKLPTQNLEAYDLYLKGHQQFLLKDEHVFKAQELLKEAVRLDPNFAMAHAGLAEAYAVYDMSFGNPEKALTSAYRALAIDSSLSSAYAVIAWTHGNPKYLTVTHTTRDPDLIYSNYERAIKLDPQNSTAHLWYGVTLIQFGLYRQAIDHLRAAVEIDALIPVNYGVLGWAEYLNGQDSVGHVHLEEAIKLGWNAGLQRLAFYYLDHNQWEKAEYYFNEHARRVTMSTQLDYHQLVTAIQKKDIQTVKRILDSITDSKGFVAGLRSRIYYLVSDYDKTVASLNDWGVSEAMRPNRKEVRKHPGFIKFVKENNFVNIWKKFGWPDVCSPVGETDFICK